LLARPFRHQGEALSTRAFKAAGFAKALKALHVPEAQIAAVREDLKTTSEVLIGGSVAGVDRIFSVPDLVSAGFETAGADVLTER
jgi:hypothetical protein